MHKRVKIQGDRAQHSGKKAVVHRPAGKLRDRDRLLPHMDLLPMKWKHLKQIWASYLHLYYFYLFFYPTAAKQKESYVFSVCVRSFIPL